MTKPTICIRGSNGIDCFKQEVINRQVILLAHSSNQGLDVTAKVCFDGRKGLFDGIIIRGVWRKILEPNASVLVSAKTVVHKRRGHTALQPSLEVDPTYVSCNCPSQEHSSSLQVQKAASGPGANR
jgi:hypothetical protein